ncbi:MAG: hypothetical protein JWR58_5882 [Pseudonocardia sp.]|jgi:hypothetical protein|nr:hypothetical protein [Pseudonocardia sp.]MDT7569120.1 hypothetical protein [Pseudonocardiales bacterium]MDT7696077.1 hypothetical protein [Pseudonocardiales bacterium]
MAWLSAAAFCSVPSAWPFASNPTQSTGGVHGGHPDDLLELLGQ